MKKIPKCRFRTTAYQQHGFFETISMSTPKKEPQLHCQGAAKLTLTLLAQGFCHGISQNTLDFHGSFQLLVGWFIAHGLPHVCGSCPKKHTRKPLLGASKSERVAKSSFQATPESTGVAAWTATSKKGHICKDMACHG